MQVPSFLKTYCFLRHLYVLQKGTEVKQHYHPYAAQSSFSEKTEFTSAPRKTSGETCDQKTNPTWIMLVCLMCEQAESSKKVPQFCPSCRSYSFSICNCRSYTPPIGEERLVPVSCTKDPPSQACEYIKGP